MNEKRGALLLDGQPIETLIAADEFLFFLLNRSLISNHTLVSPGDKWSSASIGLQSSREDQIDTGFISMCKKLKSPRVKRRGYEGREVANKRKKKIHEGEMLTGKQEEQKRREASINVVGP